MIDGRNLSKGHEDHDLHDSGDQSWHYGGFERQNQYRPKSNANLDSLRHDEVRETTSLVNSSKRLDETAEGLQEGLGRDNGDLMLVVFLRVPVLMECTYHNHPCLVPKRTFH